MQHSFRTRLLVAAAAALAAGLLGPAAAQDTKSADGWVQLFNGKDLTGWKIYPNPNPGQIKKIIEVKSGDRLTGYDGETKKDGKTVHLWRVEDGLLIGSGPSTHLFTEKGDYDNFHFRVEAKINDKGNSGQYFRTAFGPGFPKGYEAQINATHGDKIRTGSLYPSFGKLSDEDRKKILVMNDAPNKPNEFFTQEVIADGPHIQIIVNGKKTVDWVDPKNTYTKGHFALQGHDPGTVVTFRKIEYKPIKK
jgi:3-keto-disaccharide hydrolase